MNPSARKYILSILIVFISGLILCAQNNNSLTYYRASREKVNNLVHTKLDVSFNYSKQQLNGKAWITLKPHFYPTDSVKLDAKGMDIHQLQLHQNGKTSKLKYSYDKRFLNIRLNKTYTANEEYTIYIEYTAKPEELKTKGSAAILNNKGLYFINPDSTISGKPVQIWTQGETEASSVWFPTIDSPNQKTTQEISITVPEKYKTLSNGLLVKQASNNNGTRTDYWKMSQPHAPYLFMMAVGDFRITEDRWKNIPLYYYLEPDYAPYAHHIFGDTPQMMTFFSEKLGIDYPWEKYAQIVVRDFVSGAMENTTASLFGDFVHQTDREMLDENAIEDVIAHELFHHWFGNYVTAESWSNLSINESFANLSETLWKEYKYGKDEGDAKNYEDMSSYLRDPNAAEKKLIRFHYHDKEDVFDVVSYQKGGRILNMLRNYLGEDAFYKSLHLFLKQNAYKTGEAHQLRLAVEEVTGKDLNWFFNQWYFREGHPELTIDYEWNDSTRIQKIILTQTQNAEVYQLPMKIDIYSGKKKQTISYWMDKKSDTISVKLKQKPELVNVDADKILLTRKTDNKTLKEFAFQYNNAPLFLDRLEALNAALKDINNTDAQKIILSSLSDKFYKIRIKSIDAVMFQTTYVKAQSLPILRNIIKTDEKTAVQAAAIEALANAREEEDISIYKEALNSPSYAVQAAALLAVAQHDSVFALTKARELEKDSRGALAAAIVSLYTKNADIRDFDFVEQAFMKSSIQSRFIMIQDYISMLSKVNNPETIKRNVDELFNMGMRYKNYSIDQYIIGLFDVLIKFKEEQLTDADTERAKSIREQINYVELKIAAFAK